MKNTILLIIIYLVFIGLGLPDSLLGAGWPSMYGELGVPAYFAGILSFIIAGGTVIASLLSARLIRRYGVPSITTVSILLTALSLMGFSISQRFIFLCFLSIPLGLGAGCIDAALNNYVALHYKASHMNWLHSFWGVGAAIGPMIMAGYLAHGVSWSHGYETVGLIQIALVLILLCSIPLWIRQPKSPSEVESEPGISYKTLVGLPGFWHILIIFFCYCTIEATFGLWGASYLVFTRGFEPGEAAWLVSVYYGGITAGRFVSGFLSRHLNNRQLVYLGQATIVLGLVVLFLPFKATLLPGFLLIGLGCAPIFPSLLHETPRHFGEKYSQDMMGLQMASAYTGITLMPLFFGKLASFLGYSFLWWFIGIVLVIKLMMTMDLYGRILRRERI